MKFEIPKEIKSKPKLFGMEIKELVILLVSFLLMFTMLKEMVHGVFVIPYFIVCAGVLLWLVMPSRNNPGLKNYSSLYLFFKRNTYTYHALDVNKITNEMLYQDVKEGETT